jgi:hypothetical protein
MATLTPPAQLSQTVPVNVGKAFTAFFGGEFAHHLDGMSFEPTLSLVPTNLAPMASRNVLRNCSPRVAFCATPTELGLVVNESL